MNVFAATGIDSHPNDVGVYHSGAGLHPDNELVGRKKKQLPAEWASNNPLIDHATGELVSGFSVTRAPDANEIRVRRRGVSPFGGSGLRFTNGSYREKSGGTADMNTGASMNIAGGPGQASTMVRTDGPKKVDEGQKLPVLPKQTTRGAAIPVPAGGMAAFGANAPVVPKMPGFGSVVRILLNPKAASAGV